MAGLSQAVIDTLIAEAAGEGPEGMRRVAETILNRAAIRGLTPEQVVSQPHQYTGYFAPGPAAVQAQQDQAIRQMAQQAWELAMQPGDPTGGADHYYAPGTISQPSWAKSMTPTGEFGGHAFFSSRPVPPGEIPNTVASVTDTVPPRPPVPVTPSPNLDAMRKQGMPPMPIPRPSTGGLKPSQLSPASANLGDQIAMSPIMGGQQTPPMFDAFYDTRLGAMQGMAPQNTQGMGTWASPAPKVAPTPASVQDRVTARNVATANAMSAASPQNMAPVPASVEDRVTARNVALAKAMSSGGGVPYPAQQSAQIAAQRAIIPTQLPALPPPSFAPPSTAPRPMQGPPMPQPMPTGSGGSSVLDNYAYNLQTMPGLNANAPDRLAASPPGLPSLYGGGITPQQVAQIGQPAFPPPVYAPPGAASTGVATQLATMPPLPIPRPQMGMGGPAPMPSMVGGITGITSPLAMQASRMQGIASKSGTLPRPPSIVGGALQFAAQGMKPADAYRASVKAERDRAIANAAPGYNDPNALWRRKREDKNEDDGGSAQVKPSGTIW